MYCTQNIPHPRQGCAGRPHLKGFAVVVEGRAIRTRVYLTLEGAERAVARAIDRGDVATMQLVRLVQVPEGEIW